MLPDQELERLAAVRGARVTAIRLCAMRDCGEEFGEPAPSGISGVTWGVVLTCASGELAISWSDDDVGDPFRIGLIEPNRLLLIDSLVQQDVSAVPPWSGYIGSVVDSYEILSYQSNYAVQPSDATWHSVPWGILLRIGSHELLVAAANHEHPFSGPPCADDVVLAYSDAAIRRLSEVHAGERSEWRELWRAE